MTQEKQALDSTNDLNTVNILSEVAMGFKVHDFNFGTEYTMAPEGNLTPEEVKQLEEQAVGKLRQIFKILFDKEEQPLLNNPRNVLETAIMIKSFSVEDAVEERAEKNRTEIAPLLTELSEIAVKIDDDNEKFCSHPVNTEALITGDDDLIKF